MSEPKCPKCGAEMVMIYSKGNHPKKLFWGCSNYPKCNGSVNIPHEIHQLHRNEGWAETEDDDWGGFIRLGLGQ